MWIHKIKTSIPKSIKEKVLISSLPSGVWNLLLSGSYVNHRYLGSCKNVGNLP